ncbi:Hypothetical protein D9617_4g003700 [Elsinoe fawcettii]|nr:Hypothetical protein D9617_4g003700 [Elsinoe fawcettii]
MSGAEVGIDTTLVIVLHTLITAAVELLLGKPWYQYSDHTGANQCIEPTKLRPDGLLVSEAAREGTAEPLQLYEVVIIEVKHPWAEKHCDLPQQVDDLLDHDIDSPNLRRALVS